MLSLSERAAASSAGVALTGWLVGVIDLDLFGPDGAADLGTISM
ncbi:hypothetical protein [Mycolicibacterium arseniciresistens]|uniref:Uncharacterized protein n=1 Tax=Mycolicibacterium arseniciresistens TaxID=3062257 RepID=A0ABT8UHC3_9MYCO|nr:hypothetical protein [Mycolicibacterium arseniciresistens]MDO3637209.1 hypothetical protein [Mycolicibacterium arseniciresistens]